jgi:hypothetical protein
MPATLEPAWKQKKIILNTFLSLKNPFDTRATGAPGWGQRCKPPARRPSCAGVERIFQTQECIQYYFFLFPCKQKKIILNTFLSLKNPFDTRATGAPGWGFTPLRASLWIFQTQECIQYYFFLFPCWFQGLVTQKIIQIV